MVFSGVEAEAFRAREGEVPSGLPVGERGDVAGRAPFGAAVLLSRACGQSGGGVVGPCQQSQAAECQPAEQVCPVGAEVQGVLQVEPEPVGRVHPGHALGQVGARLPAGLVAKPEQQGHARHRREDGA